MKTLELKRIGSVDDAIKLGVFAFHPYLPESTQRKILKLVGDDHRGRRFIESCASRAFLLAEYLKAEKQGHTGWQEHNFYTGVTTNIPFPKNPRQSIERLRKALSEAFECWNELRGLEFMQHGHGVVSFPNRPVGNPMEQLQTLDRWAMEWEPFLQRGPGRPSGTGQQEGRLKRILRETWDFYFREAWPEREEVFNSVVALILDAVGLARHRSDIADIGRKPRRKAPAKR